MELGKIQKAWIADLRKYPERQMTGMLGKKNIETGEIKACCLGQALLTLCEIKDIEPIFSDDSSLCDISSPDFPRYSYTELGLIGERGDLLYQVSSDSFSRDSKLGKEKKYYSLSEMNDGGLTWSDIADYIETHPENIFKESK